MPRGAILAFKMEDKTHDPFLRELRTNTQFRVTFLAGLKEKRDAISQLITDGGVPSEEEIKWFLACDSILNAYSSGRRMYPPTKKIKKADFTETIVIPETLGDETNNQGNIRWLVTYLQSTAYPDKPIDRPTPTHRWYDFTPDFANPDIRKIDLRRPARTAIDHLYSFTSESMAEKRKSPQKGVPHMSAHAANPAALEAIKRIVPQAEITRRDFLVHLGKGAAAGAALASGVAVGVDAAYPGIPDVSKSKAEDRTIKALGGAALGALAGALWQYAKKDSFEDRKQVQTEIDFVLKVAGEHCLACAKEPAVSPSRT